MAAAAVGGEQVARFSQHRGFHETKETRRCTTNGYKQTDLSTYTSNMLIKFA